MVIDLSNPSSVIDAPPAAPTIDIQLISDAYVLELENGLEPFKGGHPALTEQQYTLVTHLEDFYLPNRVDVRVAAHVITPWVIDKIPYQIVLYREVEDGTVSYGLYNGISAARISLAQCIILSPTRLKELFLKPGASIEDEVTQQGLNNLQILVNNIKVIAG